MPMLKRSRASVFASHKQVEVDEFARNPLVDDYLQVAPHMSSRRSSAPTLFNSGDLPPYTASGNPPAALMQLPWQLRHAAAKADQATWARLFNEAGDPEYALMFCPEVRDPGNAEYASRVAAWAGGRSW